MKVFRIEREKYLKSTLTGIGASMTEGYRWNSLNTKLVYTAESRALAMLEISVHLDLSEDLPDDRYYIELEIPDSVTILEVSKKDLPKAWNSIPPSAATQSIGDEFVTQNEGAILKVPSALVPEEFNYLINPNNSNAQKIKILSITKLSFDTRLKKFGSIKSKK
jgi:RES domain-containing protein